MSNMNLATLDALRDRAIDLLSREKRAMHTGELAQMLGVLTHQVHSALHHRLQNGTLWFSSSDGYQLPPASASRNADDKQIRLQGGIDQ
jgi:DNA-binding IclR family transcriptional regulator